MATIRPLNVEIGTMNVVVNKQVVASDFKEIKDFMEASDADTKVVVAEFPHYPSYITKSKFPVQRDVLNIIEVV